MKFILYLIIATAFSVSCKKEDNNSPNPQNQFKLEGEWLEQTDYTKGQHEGKSQKFEFKCNSFYITISMFNDAIDPNDTCSKANWKEYVKGTYSLNDSILALDGFYSDSMFIKKTSGCYNVGGFKDSLLVTYDGEFLILNPEDQTKKMSLLKTEDFDCQE